jgi:hypothetical protein
VILSTHEIGFESLDALDGLEALCLFVGEDDRPLKGAAGYVDWRLAGAISRVLMKEFFVGAAGDCLLLPSNGRIAIPRIFACGTGKSDGFGPERLRELLADAASRLDRAKIRSVALEIPGAGVVPDEERSRAVQEAFLARFSGERVAFLADKSVGKLMPSR